MTEEISPQPTESELLTALRDEMQTQYNTLKEAMESALKERDDTIATLRQEKQSLQNALVVSSTTPKAEEPPVKTEEELYEEKVIALSQRTLASMAKYR